MNTTDNNIITIPVLAMRGAPVFPYSVTNFEIGREITRNAVDIAMSRDRKILVVAQRDDEIEHIQTEDLYNTGTICVIKQVLRSDNKFPRVLVEGIERARIIDFTKTKGHFECSAYIIDRPPVDDDDEIICDAYMRRLRTAAVEYFSYMGQHPDETEAMFDNEKDPYVVYNILCSSLLVDSSKKQQLLECDDIVECCMSLLNIICREIAVLKIEREIAIKARNSMEEAQRDYFLREQMQAIREELGESENTDDEAQMYTKRLNEISLPQDIREKIAAEIKRLSKMQYSSPEAMTARNYLDRIFELPWGIKTKENGDFEKAEKILADSHYGMDKVKERIMEFLAVRKLSNGKKSPVICLVGPPGVGKTSIAKSVAEALGRKYVRMSLGGVHDEAEIRGHRRTYVGAMPGRIALAIKQAGSFNPLILLDEIDKVGSDYRGSISDALLEVLDTEQNSAFRDHYLEVGLDLSDVLFFTTANSLDTVDRPLLDRMEIIEVNGYTDEEKLHIAKNHIIGKQAVENGLKKSNIKISDSAVLGIIHYYTRESGVRELERKIAAIMRKAAGIILNDGKKSVSVSEKSLEKFLGRKIYSEPEADKKDCVGVATGLAWTQYGGDTLSIEVNTMDGSGNVELTGQLGDVMKESAKAAISYIRSNASHLGIKNDFHSNKDLHIHIPEGAIPKDGPSAGITMATAIVSSLTGRKVSKKVAMTGEITITGRILPIGGLKEKSLAAYRAGIKTILIPKENMADTYDLPDEIRKEINFVVADSMDKVLSTAMPG